MSNDMAASNPSSSSAGMGLEAASQKKYLKWYNKVGYGLGDVAGNVVYALLSAFVMIYLADTAGLNPGVVGTLMMLSKVFDGISDMIFGTLLDRTNTRMGKARPWMLWAYVGCAVLLVAIFAIPPSLGDFAKYTWFFIAYTLLNAVFFTANNIAYHPQQGRARADGVHPLHVRLHHEHAYPNLHRGRCHAVRRRGWRLAEHGHRLRTHRPGN